MDDTRALAVLSRLRKVWKNDTRRRDRRGGSNESSDRFLFQGLNKLVGLSDRSVHVLDELVDLGVHLDQLILDGGQSLCVEVVL